MKTNIITVIFLSLLFHGCSNTVDSDDLPWETYSFVLKGNVTLYNEFGLEASDHSGSTISFDNSFNPTTTDSIGDWTIESDNDSMITESKFEIRISNIGYSLSVFESFYQIEGGTKTIQDINLYELPQFSFDSLTISESTDSLLGFPVNYLNISSNITFSNSDTNNAHLALLYTGDSTNVNMENYLSLDSLTIQGGSNLKFSRLSGWYPEAFQLEPDTKLYFVIYPVSQNYHLSGYFDEKTNSGYGMAVGTKSNVVSFTFP